VPVFSAQAGFPRVTAEVVDWYLARYPVRATRAGEHAHDARIGAIFPGDLEGGQRDVRALLTRLQTVNRPTLARPDYVDYRVLEYALREELLDIETLGGWLRDPLRYTRLIVEAQQALRDAAELSADARAQAQAARLREVPLVFRAARQNLDAARVPPLFVRLAIEDLRSGSERLRAADPGTGAAAGTRNEWEAARRVALASADTFAAWLAQTLAPAATGQFRLGAAGLAELLRYRHHVEIPLDDLLAINRQAIAEYQEWMERVALDHDPLTHPAHQIEAIAAASPHGKELLPPLLFPGEAPAPATRVRTIFGAPGLREAWAHYMDMAALETEAVGNADRLAGLRRALHAHALLHAMLVLHAGDATIDGVAQDIAGIAMIDFESARREAERIAHDPGAGLVALGRMQLFALRERMRAEDGRDFDEAAFADEVLALGLPITLAAEAMLGRAPGPLLVRGARTPGVPEPPRLLD
jgi:hypothetical protein